MEEIYRQSGVKEKGGKEIGGKDRIIEKLGMDDWRNGYWRKRKEIPRNERRR